MISPFVTLCPSFTGRWTSTPGTWNASCTCLDASTLPGNVWVSGSVAPATAIVLTGRIVSGRSVSWREHAAERQTMDNTKDDAKRRLRTLHTIGNAPSPSVDFYSQNESGLNHKDNSVKH